MRDIRPFLLVILLVLLAFGGASSAPIPDNGFRVLIAYESSSAEQQSGTAAVLHSSELMRFLNEECVKEEGRPAWRKWDVDNDVSAEPELWQNALERAVGDAGGVLPWLLVSNGKTGDSFAMPDDLEPLLTRLKKHL